MCSYATVFPSLKFNMMKQIIAAIFLFAFVAQIDAFPKRSRYDVSDELSTTTAIYFLKMFSGEILFHHREISTKN